MEKVLNSNYDRILGRFPLSKDGEVYGIYARQGNKRFVSSVVFPDHYSEADAEKWLSENEGIVGYRDEEVVWRATKDGEGFEVDNPVIFRSGEWKGIQITPQDMQSIQENAIALKEYGETHQPVLLNHDDSDIEKKVGRIIEPKVVADKVIPTKFLLTEANAIRKYLNGTYGAISPHLKKDYTFDTGNGKKTLPGWTFREVSFVVHPQDKALNLTMNESEAIITMDEKNKGTDNIELQLSEANQKVLKLQGDLATANSDLVNTKQQLQMKETEVNTLKQKVIDLQDEAKKNAVETEIKNFEAKFKLKPADHEKNVAYVLSLSEDQLNFWRDDVESRPEFVIKGTEGQDGSQKKDTPQASVKSPVEYMTRNNIQPIKGGN